MGVVLVRHVCLMTAILFCGGVNDFKGIDGFL